MRSLGAARGSYVQGACEREETRRDAKDARSSAKEARCCAKSAWQRGSAAARQRRAPTALMAPGAENLQTG